MIRILLTGGGTGGHFYPLFAVAQELKKELQGKLYQLYYIGPKNELWQSELEKEEIRTFTILGSKWRRYSAGFLQNVFDIPKLFLSILEALVKIYFIMPDVVFSKAGTGALPIVIASWFYRIPIMIHESDAIPGLTNRLSAYFAKRIGISFEKAWDFFPQSKTALVGNPIRNELFLHLSDQNRAKEKWGFSLQKPLIFVLGGSQGATPLNTLIFEEKEAFLGLGNVLHQTGKGNLNLIGDEKDENYQAIEYLNIEELRDALTASDIVISRAGSSAIYEISAFGKPSILIPLDKAASDHQRANAYAYAKTGATIVIEETNLTINSILFQIKNLLEKKELYNQMQKSALLFFKPHATEMIAKEILLLGTKNFTKSIR